MKKILAMALAVGMVFAFVTACGNNAPEPGAPAPSEPAAQAPSAPAPGGDDALPPATVTVFFIGSTVSDDRHVVEAANARLKELGTNITFNPIWGTWGDFETRAVTALDTGDTNIDIIFTCSWTQNNYVQYAKVGAYQRLDDPNDNLLEQYGRDIKAAVPDLLWDAFTVEGNVGMGIYGFPGYKDYAQMYTWDVNNTLLSELGFDFNSFEWNSETFFSPEFAQALAKAKEEKGASFYPLNFEAETFARHISNGDADPTQLLYLGFDPKNPTLPANPVIESRFDTDVYARYMDKIREFYVAGYIDPRMSNREQAQDAFVAARDTAEYLFSSVTYAYGWDIQASRERGIDARFPAMSSAIVSTGSAQGAGYALSAYSQNKPQAVQFMNLWYTDPELATILAYGIEGIEYIKNADGTVTFDNDARMAFNPWRNGMGNIFILPPEDAMGPNYWNEFKAYNEAGVGTALLGFTFDPEPVRNELATLTNALHEFQFPILSGAIDPAQNLPELKSRLDANGAGKVVDEYNKQVQAFLSAK